MMGLDPITMLAGGSIISGLLGADASSNASDTQANSANQATASQQAMFDKIVDLESPFRQFGLASGGKLAELLGLNGGSGALLNQTSNFKPFSMSDFQLDPGIQFQQKYGQQALLNSQAAKDGVLSGGALKDLLTFNQGLAGTGYQSAFDRYMANNQTAFNQTMANKNFALGSLLGMTNLGQSAASNTAQTGPGFSKGISDTIVGAGQAQAAGQVGVANALSGGIGGASNAYFLNSLLNKQSPAAGAGVMSDGASIGNFA